MRWWTLYTEERLIYVVLKWWKAGSARMLGDIGRRYKFIWQCCNKGTAGVGVFIAEKKKMKKKI